MTQETEWPFRYDGIVESVASTRQPDTTWNIAALGVYPGKNEICATTWDRTRTRRNLEASGKCFIQVTSDPVVFARAALETWTRSKPVLPEAAAWVEAEANRIDSGFDGETEWVEWSLTPEFATINERQVPIPTRGRAAVIEMTVAASRLGNDAFEDEPLRDRLDYFAGVAEKCGGEAERRAVERIMDILTTNESIERKPGCEGGEGA